MPASRIRKREEVVKMELNNAKKGVGLIYIGEILSVCAIILAAVSSVIIVISATNGGATNITEGGLAGIGLVAILGLAAVVLAFIFQVVGISRASKDEPEFKKAMAFLIGGLVVAFVAGFFGNNETAKDITGVLSNLCSLMVTIYIIQGCGFLAKRVGNEHVEKLAASTVKLITALYVVSILLGVVLAFISAKEMVVTAGIIAIVVAVVSVIAYILFLKVLSQTKNML